MNIKQHAWSNKVTMVAAWEHKKGDVFRHSPHRMDRAGHLIMIYWSPYMLVFPRCLSRYVCRCGFLAFCVSSHVLLNLRLARIHT